MRTTELVECSHTSSRPFASSVVPLPLLLGLATSRTPPCPSQRRRVSPGMSLERRNRPAAIHDRPSVRCEAGPDPLGLGVRVDQLVELLGFGPDCHAPLLSCGNPAARTYHR